LVNTIQDVLLILVRYRRCARHISYLFLVEVGLLSPVLLLVQHASFAVYLKKASSFSYQKVLQRCHGCRLHWPISNVKKVA